MVARASFMKGRSVNNPEMECRRGGMYTTMSSSRSATAVKTMNVSTGMATETRSVKAWVSPAASLGVKYAHGEDVVPGAILLGEGLRRRELNAWLPLRPNVGGVLRSVTLA